MPSRSARYSSRKPNRRANAWATSAGRAEVVNWLATGRYSCLRPPTPRTITPFIRSITGMMRMQTLNTLDGGPSTPKNTGRGRTICDNVGSRRGGGASNRFALSLVNGETHHAAICRVGCPGPRWPDPGGACPGGGRLEEGGHREKGVWKDARRNPHRPLRPDELPGDDGQGHHLRRSPDRAARARQAGQGRGRRPRL